MENATKLTMAHIASEIIVIGGISYLFNKRISELNNKVSVLEKKIETLETGNNKNDANVGISNEQFSQFQQQTSHHINNIYNAIKQLSSISFSDNQHESIRKPHIPSSQQIRHRKPLSQQPSQHHLSESKSNFVQQPPRHVSFSLTSIENHPLVSGYHQQPSSSVEIVDESQQNNSKSSSNELMYQSDPDSHSTKLNIEDEKKINDEDLDQELEDELKELEHPTKETSIIDIKNEDEHITNIPSTSEESSTPLEFVIPKSVKKQPRKNKQN